MRKDNLIGQKFGKLTVIEEAEKKGNAVCWLCQCDCGNTIIVRGHCLKTGVTRSCGCLQKEEWKQSLIGKKFNKLTVLEFAYTKNGSNYFLCKCECGNKKIIKGCLIKNGNTKSCGCLQKQKAKEIGNRSKKHGLYKTRLYKIWKGIHQRCYNPKHTYYKNYGGRGITICNEWLNDFIPFYEWAIKNKYNDKLSIDRIDNNKGYSPNNCKWATRKEQGNNQRTNILITYENKTHTISEWADLLKMPYKKLHKRLRIFKWEVKRAFTTP